MKVKNLEGYRLPKYDEIVYIRSHPPSKADIGLSLVFILLTFCIGMIGLSYIVQGCSGVPIPYLTEFKEGVDFKFGSFVLGFMFSFIGFMPFIAVVSSMQTAKLIKSFVQDGSYKVLTAQVTAIRRSRDRHIAIKYVTETGQRVEDWTILCRPGDLTYYRNHNQLSYYFIKFPNNTVDIVRKE